jgi:hypothetical protein
MSLGVAILIALAIVISVILVTVGRDSARTTESVRVKTDRVRRRPPLMSPGPQAGEEAVPARAHHEPRRG